MMIRPAVTRSKLWILTYSWWDSTTRIFFWSKEKQMSWGEWRIWTRVRLGEQAVTRISEHVPPCNSVRQKLAKSIGVCSWCELAGLGQDWWGSDNEELAVWQDSYHSNDRKKKNLNLLHTRAEKKTLGGNLVFNNETLAFYTMQTMEEKIFLDIFIQWYNTHIYTHTHVDYNRLGNYLITNLSLAWSLKCSLWSCSEVKFMSWLLANSLKFHG